MKRLIVFIAISFMVEILVSCGTGTESSTSANSPLQVSATLEEISTKQSTASIPPPSGTQRLKPSLTPPKPPPTSTKDPNIVSLPSSPDVPPGDILAQIAYISGGGGHGAPQCDLVCGNNHEITLQGYSPFQELRIIVYTIYDFYEPALCGVFSVGEYTTERFVTVDRTGFRELSVSGASTEDHIYVYYVFDARTGDFIDMSAPLLIEHDFEEVEAACPSVSSNSSNSCPGAPPQRMTVGERGYVCTAVDNVKVRDLPSRSGNEIIRLAPGTEFNVQEGPSCSDDWSWWYIETDDSIEGWIAEGGDEIDPYFICPSP